MEILQRAKALVQNNHLLSTQHVMLEALERPNLVGMEWQLVLQELGDANIAAWKATTRGFVAQENSKPEPPRSAESSGMTEQLLACQQAWNMGRDTSAPPKDTLVVLTIIARDQQTWAAIQGAGLPLPTVIEQRLRALLSSNTTPPPPDNTFREDTQAHRIVNFLVRPVNPSNDRHYAQFHAPQMNNTLRRISELTQTQLVPVCIGPYGSLIDILETILADHYVTPKIPFAGDQSALNAFDKVYKLDLASLRLQSRTDQNVRLDRVLEKAKEKAQQENALLLIDHIELLGQTGTTANYGASSAMRPQGALQPQAVPTSAIPGQAPQSAPAGSAMVPVTPYPLAPAISPSSSQPGLPSNDEQSATSRLRDHIANRGECFIIGLYRMTREEDPQAAARTATLGDANIMQALPLSALTENETLRLLDSMYFRRWGSMNFTFTARSFEAVFRLKEGIVIDDKPWELPLAAVRLGEGFIKTIGDNALLDTVKRAIEETKRLIEKDAESSSKENAGYKKNLQVALKDLGSLNDRLEGKQRPIFVIGDSKSGIHRRWRSSQFTYLRSYSATLTRATSSIPRPCESPGRGAAE
jgi:hypothetical protein